MRKVFFTSDQHFNHDNIIRYCNRKFENVHEMNETIINNWNDVVGDNDLVYILGDITLNNPKDVEHLIVRLKGNKILVKGNHDKSNNNNKWVKMGFICVVDRIHMNIANKPCILSHFPFRCNYFKYLYERYIKGYRHKDYNDRIKQGEEFLLCGHSHSYSKSNGKQINVNVEAWNYKPVSLQEVELIINKYKD